MDGEIKMKKEEVEQWKEEKDFDLNQHRLRNDIKNIRMQLMV